MNALNDGIGLEEQQLVGHTEIEHRTIVTGADDDRFVRRQRTGQQFDQIEFVHRN
jgi:hypothetical protein